MRAIVSVAVLLAAPGPALGERLPIRTYTTVDGLRSAFILRIVRDSRGFLWFCTADGLSRYDGDRFVNYTMEHGLTNPRVNHLLETRNGIYWVATNGGGVCRFDPNPARGSGRLFTAYAVGDEPLTNRVNVLCEDRNGRIWAATDGGLFRLEGTNGQETFGRVDKPGAHLPRRSLSINSMVEDREGGLWMGTETGVFRRLPDGQTIHVATSELLVGGPGVPLLEDHEKRVWVGHSGGVTVMKPEPAAVAARALRTHQLGRAPPAARPPNAPVQLPSAPGEALRYTVAHGLAGGNVLYASRDGTIWIATSGGLTEFDGRRFRSYTAAHGLGDNLITSVAEDGDGNLWVGSQAGGAMKVALDGLTTYDETDGIGRASKHHDTAFAPARIHAIYQDRSGNLFAVSGDWNINRFNGSRFIPAQATLPEDRIHIYASQVAFLDRIGRWWMLTTQGLYRFDGVDRIEDLARRRPDRIYGRRDGFGESYPFRLFEDSRGDVWIARSGSDAGLTRWEATTGTLHRYVLPEGLSASNMPSAFCEDRFGALWVGFYEGGLACYTGGRFRLFKDAEGLPAGMVTGLHLDRTGRIWVATNQGGLARIDDPLAERPRFRVYTTAEGLASNNVRCITEDRWGRIYVGTARGVDQIHTETGAVRHHTTADGLANDFVTVAFCDRSGDLWFGTLKGLSRLVPQPEKPQQQPPVWIGALAIAGAPQPMSALGETVVPHRELEPSQNRITIDFFGLGFRTGETLRYQYMLEGADRDWSPPDDRRSVHYASLAPGRYRFSVRAVSSTGAVSPTPAVASFAILPPVWQRWWFLSLAAVAAGLAVYGLHRHRVGRLLELERVHTRIAADLHDDVGSSLSQISVLSEVARRQADGDREVSEALSTIAELARSLADSMSDVVWAVNPQRDRISDLIQRMRRFASEVFAARDMELHFHTAVPEQDLKLAGDMRRELFLVFKESVHNAARHSGGSETEVELRVDDGAVELRVRDNGRGFEPARAAEGNGLASMRRRARNLGGALEVISAEGRGTTIRLRAPLQRRGWIRHGSPPQE